MKNAEVIAESIKREYLEKLRDDFAAKAMQSLMEAQMKNSGNGCLSGNGNGANCRERLAKESYEMADSMLKSRDAD